MEARAGGDVEIEIGVMHPVQAPQRRHGMEHHVLQPDEKIQNHDRGKHGQPVRDLDVIEQAPAMFIRNSGHAHRGSRKDRRNTKLLKNTRPRLLAQRTPCWCATGDVD